MVETDCITFEVWQDLGSGFAPSDEYWINHIWDIRTRDCWPSSKNSFEHGSIRDLYCNESNVQGLGLNKGIQGNQKS
jgi:hypothetical protein